MFSSLSSHWLLVFALVQAICSQELDIARSGNYFFRNCGAGDPNGYAAKLQVLLPQIYNNLQAVIADAALGTSSRHGYATFFQNNDNTTFVQDIFRYIAAGSPVALPPVEGQSIVPLGYPMIVCLLTQYPETSELLRACGQEMRGVAAGRKNNLVILCPLFWLTPEQPTSDKCPRVRRNTLTPNDDSLAINQQSILVHELAHVYGVYTGKNWQEGNFEQYRIRNASLLPPEEALLNAPNYAFYYSGV